jgi:hypothetical protein
MSNFNKEERDEKTNFIFSNVGISAYFNRNRNRF